MYSTSSLPQDGVFDKRCIQLAELCNQAVDYPRNGRPVNIEGMPERLFRKDPDWKKREGESDESKFYPSQRAVGKSLDNVDTQFNPGVPK